MDLQAVFQDPVFWGSVIMLLYPQAFDLFEQLLSTLGLIDFFSTPVRKKILAWIMAFPVSLGALWVLSLVWPVELPFNFDAAMVLATGIVAIITSEGVTFSLFKRRAQLTANR